MPRRRSPGAVGSRNRWCRCPTRRRSTICRSRTAARSPCRRWKATRSRVSQCGRFGRHPQHPRDLDQRAVRRRHGRVRAGPDSQGAVAEISQRRRRGGDHACLWLRRRDQRARRCRTDPHPAQPGPQSQFRRRGDDRRPGLREATARTVAARGHDRRRPKSCGCRTKASRDSARSSRTSCRWPTRACKILNRRRRETCPASALVVGMQCGGSDAFSGVTANPAWGSRRICWCAPARP